ncbi:hypothetical protein NTCA1_41370 [Novosphingobium sp. TCA1]|nr:hypothetical protein NTCA1_41370 [Novosphingobium sp. TCA1]
MLKVSTESVVAAIPPSGDRVTFGGSVALHATSAEGGAMVLHPLASRTAPKADMRRRNAPLTVIYPRFPASGSLAMVAMDLAKDRPRALVSR